VAPDRTFLPAVTNVPPFAFSITYIGDLVLATVTLDALAANGPVTVITSGMAGPLMAHDPRACHVVAVNSSHPLGWRAKALKLAFEARRSRAPIVNLEVYAPRWRDGHPAGLEAGGCRGGAVGLDQSGGSARPRARRSSSMSRGPSGLSSSSRTTGMK
jgi:hypothetical protein